MNTYIILAILLSAGITMGLRALPFAVFRGKREKPGKYERRKKSQKSLYRIRGQYKNGEAYIF